MWAGPAHLLESMIGRTSANTLVTNSELHFNRGNKGLGQKRLLRWCTQQLFTEASHATTRHQLVATEPLNSHRGQGSAALGSHLLGGLHPGLPAGVQPAQVSGVHGLLDQEVDLPPDAEHRAFLHALQLLLQPQENPLRHFVEALTVAVGRRFLQSTRGAPPRNAARCSINGHT